MLSWQSRTTEELTSSHLPASVIRLTSKRLAETTQITGFASSIGPETSNQSGQFLDTSIFAMQGGGMRIGITCYPTYGGSGVVATELGIELAARGHEIHFITYSQPFRLTGREANIHFHEVAVSNYPLFEHPPYDLALATRMAEVAEFYSLDLLHVHYAIPHSVSALLARQMLASRGLHLPFITTLHGTDIT